MPEGPASDLASMDVLVVDDAASVRSSVAAHLEDVGVPPEQIHQAENAREALVFCDSGAPDLMLLDLVLPDIPGEEVGSVLMEEHPEMRVVPLTALDPQDGRVRQMIALGAFDVLQKPIRRHSLEALFEDLRRESEVQPTAEEDRADEPWT